MKRTELAPVFQQYQDLLWERCWSFHSTTGRDVNDLMGVAHRSFMYAAESWVPEKGAFLGWLRRHVNQGLSDYVRKVDLPLAEEPDMSLLECNRKAYDPSQVLMMKESLEGLSEEAKYVVHVLLEAPREVLHLEGSETARFMRTRLQKHLRDEKKWTWTQIWKVGKEIRATIAAM